MIKNCGNCKFHDPVGEITIVIIKSSVVTSTLTTKGICAHPIEPWNINGRSEVSWCGRHKLRRGGR